MPAVGWSGSVARRGSPRGPRSARRRGSRRAVRPVTVSAVGSSRSRTSRSTASRPPARWKSSIRNRPAGCRSTSSGTSAPVRSKSSRVSSTPSRPAIASRWTTALVEPPIAASATIALRNEPRVRTSLGRRASCDHLDREPAGLVRSLEQPAVRGRRAGHAGDRHAERLGHAAPSSTRCPSCCSARGCGSSTTRTAGTPPRTACRRGPPRDSRHTSVPQPSGYAAEGAGQHRTAGHARPPAGRPTRRPSAATGSSCRSRRAARRRRSGWRAASPRSPSRPCCARASRSGGPGSRRATRPGRFERDAAGLVDALLDALGDLVEVRVAGRQVGRGVGDRDVRAAVEGVGRQAAAHPGPVDVGVAVACPAYHCGCASGRPVMATFQLSERCSSIWNVAQPTADSAREEPAARPPRLVGSDRVLAVLVGAGAGTPGGVSAGRAGPDASAARSPPCTGRWRRCAGPGFAAQDGRGRYVLGDEFLRLAFAQPRGPPRARPGPAGARALAERFDETAHYAVLDGRSVVYRAKVDPPSARSS